MSSRVSLCGSEALDLLDAGIPTIAIWGDGSKAPTRVGWQLTARTAKDIHREHADADLGLAAVPGLAEGLEDLDIDAPELIEPWRALIVSEAPGLTERLVEIETPSGGRAFAYRHDGAREGNQKLAQEVRWDPAQGRRRPHTLIETRGDGGYFLIPPTPAHCHPDGRPYVYRQGHLRGVPTITAQERTVLLDAARSFNKMPWRVHEGPRREHSSVAAETRPGDAYAASTDWPAILDHRGWVAVYRRGGTTYWRWPGKSRGVSATTNFAGSGLLYVFSSNAAPFDNDNSYTKFAAYTLLEHEGNYAAAAYALATQGYGELGAYAREHHGGDLRAAAKDLAGQSAEKQRDGRVGGYQACDRLTGEARRVGGRPRLCQSCRPAARYTREVR